MKKTIKQMLGFLIVAALGFSATATMSSFTSSKENLLDLRIVKTLALDTGETDTSGGGGGDSSIVTPKPRTAVSNECKVICWAKNSSGAWYSFEKEGYRIDCPRAEQGDCTTVDCSAVCPDVL